MVTIMHIEELLDIEDHGERDRQLRRYLAPYSAEIGVDGAEKMALVVLLNLTLKRDRVESLCDEGLARQLLSDEGHGFDPIDPDTFSRLGL